MNMHAANLVCICIDRPQQTGLCGRLYTRQSPEPQPFQGMTNLLLQMEHYFDRLQMPQASTAARSFSPTGNSVGNSVKKEVNAMCDHDLTTQKGEEGTFIVHVQYRQNATWQGQVTWADKNVTQSFRSALELLKLIDGALDTSAE